MYQLRSFLQVYRHPRGFSLIELMIALALGLLIMAAVIQLFIGSRQTYSTNEALARVQENGRFAMELIKPEIRAIAAGQGFCAGQIAPTIHLELGCDADLETLYDMDHAVLGWEYSGTAIRDEFDIPADLDPNGIDVDNWENRFNGAQRPLPGPLHDRVVPGTDVLVIQQMDILPVELASPGVASSESPAINVASGANSLPERGLLMVVNCASRGADVFQQVAGQSAPNRPQQPCAAGRPGNRSPVLSPWAHNHDSSSSVVRQSTVAFYIGFNADRNEPGLYRMDMSAGLTTGDLVIEELVEGIENMQILFGFSNPDDEGGDGQSVNFWLTASQVTDWGLVIAVRLSMLSRSQSNAESRAESFTFDLAGTTLTTPSDRRLRQPFNTTLALRNRLIVQ